jgi:hypothetical protein
MRAKACAPARTRTERLTELDGLLPGGRIRLEEFQVARVRVLTG